MLSLHSIVMRIFLVFSLHSHFLQATNLRSLPSSRFNSHNTRSSITRSTSLFKPNKSTILLLQSLRGGSETIIQQSDKKSDEERYSRQFYTLGARAHSLVRSSTMVIDGSVKSGLVYETVKNLALSGVGRVIILTNILSRRWLHQL